MTYIFIQEKAFKEVRGVLKDKPAPTSIAEVNEMRYVDCIVRETLRLFPVLAFITRKTTIPIELGINTTNAKNRK